MKKNPDKLIRQFLGIGADKNFGQEPTYMGFAINFDFDNIGYKSDINSITPGLLLDDNDLDSSINYLRRIGHEERSNYLVEFRNQLKDIQDNKPWYFQSISGLEEIWKRPDGPENTVVYHDLPLTIECLESLDLKMTFLAMLYKKSKSDSWQRTLLPLEKRQFHARVIVCEIRNLNKVKETIDTADGIVNDIGSEKPNTIINGFDSITSALNKNTIGIVGDSTLAQTYAANKMAEAAELDVTGINTDDPTSITSIDWEYIENLYGSNKKIMNDPGQAFANLNGDFTDTIFETEQ